MTGNSRKVLVVMLIVISMLLGGCWSRRDVERLAFVLAVAVDKAQDPDKVQLTVELARPSALTATSQGGGSLESAVWRVSSTGYTVFDAIRNFASQVPRQLFWSHNRLIVFGEEIAREGLEDVLDAFFRDPEMRRSVKVIVCKGDTGANFLLVDVPLERVLSGGIQGIISSSVEKLSTMVDIGLNYFGRALSADGLEPIAVRGEIIDLPPDEDPRGSLERTKISKAPRITGAAVFKGTKLVGWLDKPEARGFNWIKGKIGGGVITVEKPNERNKFIAVEIVRTRSNIKTEIVGGKPKVTIKVECMGNFADRENVYVNPEGVAPTVLSIERQMAAVIRNEIEAAVKKAKEFGSDIFGFGEAFYRFHPKEWKRLREDWNDKGFRELQVEVEVKAMLRRSGLIELEVPLGK
ncbi:MAG TPA: Ger(x)C family spore germination protein [Firmicutes bacterium]|nr:Ger(x)C family spore germination protein [Bacillota bacterium]